VVIAGCGEHADTR